MKLGDARARKELDVRGDGIASERKRPEPRPDKVAGRVARFLAEAVGIRVPRGVVPLNAGFFQLERLRAASRNDRVVASMRVAPAKARIKVKAKARDQ